LLLWLKCGSPHPSRAKLDQFRKLRRPLPLVAAQNLAPSSHTPGRAATEGSGFGGLYLLRKCSSVLGSGCRRVPWARAGEAASRAVDWTRGFLNALARDIHYAFRAASLSRADRARATRRRSGGRSLRRFGPGPGQVPRKSGARRFGRLLRPALAERGLPGAGGRATQSRW
jgi:hypothetical protein